MRYLISYDLLEDADYGTLYSVLEGMGARRVLHSQWVVRLPGESAKLVLNRVRDRFRHIKNFRILVVSLDDAGKAERNLMVDLDSFKEP